MTMGIRRRGSGGKRNHVFCVDVWAALRFIQTSKFESPGDFQEKTGCTYHDIVGVWFTLTPTNHIEFIKVPEPNAISAEAKYVPS